ncbi:MULTISPECIES: DUF350 domain-containing protein [unclassified Halomonas]|uniref:DUF350 domain-containing protein n=1 Tax=unclassified Halomonas TaxID=2609666 RepID=UPI002076756F|nr:MULTISPECIES: DUF350 domain-containing protein [unclassified Halomonas]UYG00367.1 DUF350 domain-containing protein [Halomonas sp. GD1P12]WNL38558.1 DUF350 domain-containing protein [Halomonas sp. PAMB 3232]WNL41904.1 DUF350 domain-containing protein [Halomonas sp. PAMB 3264]
MNYLQGLPHFLGYLIGALILLGAFMYCYSRITPHKEWALIRQGNAAAATAYAGSIIGFTLPLYSAMANSINFIDFLLWGVIAFGVQLATFFGLKVVLQNQGESLSTHINEGHMAYGILVGSICIAVGLLNAASMTW